MKRILSNKIFLDLLFIFFLSLTPLLWFREGTVIVGHDNVFGLDPTGFLKGRLSTWIEHGFGRSQDLIMGTIPVHIIDAIPALLGFPLETTQKIVYIFWFFMMGVAAYVLASTINPQSRIFKLTAVVLYQFNFFILQGWFMGERTKFSAYVAFALILAIFLKVYYRKLGVLRASIYNSLIFLVFNGGGIFGLPLFGGFIVSFLSFVIFFSLLSFFRKQYALIRSLFLVSILTFLGFLLVNAYYIFPAAFQLFSSYSKGLGEVGGISGIVNWASEISVGSSFANLFRLQGIAEWYDNPQHPYAHLFLTNPLLIIASFIWLLFWLLALFLIKEKKKLELVIYFFLMLLVGVFFAAGTHPPLGTIYVQLIQYFPGFAVFRSPYFKFAPAIFLASAFLISFFVDNFRGRWKIAVFLFVIVFTLVYYFPYFTIDFFSWRQGFTTRNVVPEYVFEFGEWMRQHHKDGRILLLPELNSHWQYDLYGWGYLSLQSLPSLITNGAILSNEDKLEKNERKLLSLMYAALANKNREMLERYASLLGIKYLMVRNDFQYDLDWIPTTNPGIYEETIYNYYGYPLVGEFGKWHLYQIQFQKKYYEPPKIFTIDEVDVLNGETEKLDSYFDNSSGRSQFFIRGDEDIIKPVQLPPSFLTNYYIPYCLSCKYITKPNIELPDRIILPDSLFYKLVLINDDRKINASDNKRAIFDYLGLTLKRESELRQMVFQNKRLTGEIFELYGSLIDKISQNFSTLQRFDDKFEVAETVDYYLLKEASILVELMGRPINADNKEEKLNQLFSKIARVREQISPYIINRDPLTYRLYYFYIDKSGSYNVLFQKKDPQGANDLDEFLRKREKVSISISVDDKPAKELDMNKVFTPQSWLLLDNVQFSPGYHKVLLSYKNIPNLAGDLEMAKSNIPSALKGNVDCYSSKINRFNNKKTYRMSFDTPGDILSDSLNTFYFYVEREKKNGKKIDGIVKISSLHFEDLVRGSLQDVAAPNIGFCSTNLSVNQLQSRLNLRVEEVVNLVVAVVPQAKAQSTITPISFKKFSPTQYEIDLAIDNPQILIFSERFDNGWELERFNDKHFKVNSYANAWLIDQPGTYKLRLVYKPQTFFYYGVLISFLSVIVFLVYLKMERKDNN